MPRRPPLRLLRLANPGVRLVLRSPLHGLLSSRLALLTYRDATRGRSRAIPVLYATAGTAVITLAVDPERKRWWRAFRDGGEARLRLAGRDVPMRGRLLGPAEAPAALRAYLIRHRRAAGALGVGVDGATEELEAAAANVALVAFERSGNG